MDPRALDHLLSVDPGAHSAWVLWSCEGTRIWMPLRVGRESSPSARECLRLMGQLLPSWERAAVVVEGQYYERPGRAAKRGRRASPWQDVATLIEVRCRWQHAAEIAGASDVQVVAPGVWIPALSSDAPGSDSKARIRWVVEHAVPALGVSLVRDEFDAAGLGLWWVRQFGGRVAAPARIRGREAGGGRAASTVGDDDAARRAGSTGAGNPGWAGSTPGAVSSSEVDGPGDPGEGTGPPEPSRFWPVCSNCSYGDEVSCALGHQAPIETCDDYTAEDDR